MTTKQITARLNKISSYDIEANSDEVNHIYRLLQKVAPLYYDEIKPATSMEAARIIADWYANEFENIMKITKKFLYEDLRNFVDVPMDLNELKTVFPNYGFGEDDEE